MGQPHIITVCRHFSVSFIGTCEIIDRLLILPNIKLGDRERVLHVIFLRNCILDGDSKCIFQERRRLDTVPCFEMNTANPKVSARVGTVYPDRLLELG